MFVAIYNVPLNVDGVIAHFKFIVGSGVEQYRIYENSLRGHLEMLLRSVRLLAFAHGWPMFVVCACGVAWAFWRRQRSGSFLFPLVFVISYHRLLHHGRGLQLRSLLHSRLYRSIHLRRRMARIAAGLRTGAEVRGEGVVAAALGYSVVYAASVML